MCYRRLKALRSHRASHSRGTQKFPRARKLPIYLTCALIYIVFMLFSSLWHSFVIMPRLDELSELTRFLLLAVPAYVLFALSSATYLAYRDTSAHEACDYEAGSLRAQNIWQRVNSARPAIANIISIMLISNIILLLYHISIGKATRIGYGIPLPKIWLIQALAAFFVVLPQVLGEEILFRVLLLRGLEASYLKRVASRPLQQINLSSSVAISENETSAALAINEAYLTLPLSKKEQWAKMLWVVVSSALIFSAAHFPSTLISAGEYLIASLVLGLLAYLRRDIVLSTTFHLVNNLLLLYLQSPSDATWQLYPIYKVPATHNLTQLGIQLLICTLIFYSAWRAHSLTGKSKEPIV